MWRTTLWRRGRPWRDNDVDAPILRPTLAGRVMVRFTIQERGNVSNATATENSTGSPAVATCVVNTIRRFRFNPGPEGGSVSFAYPFVFAPQN